MVQSHTQLATYLRLAAERKLSEDDFYSFFREWYRDNQDGIADIIHGEVEHFWSNFHKRNIFFVRVKPSKAQLEDASQRLRILARAVEENWTPEKTKSEIREW